MAAESPSPSPSINEAHSVTKKAPEDEVKANALKEDVPSPSYNVRTVVGEGMHKFTDLINDNIIAARFGVFATVSLLTAYGIAHTPLFFRYRTVAEVPRSYFVGRRHLYCRIIGVHRDSTANASYSAKQNGNESIQISVRHLSPIARLLPTSWYESLMKISPKNSNFSRGLTSGGKAEESSRELLRLQIVGVQTPPLSRTPYDPEEFLKRLAKKRTLVSCQLLGRRVIVPQEEEEEYDHQNQRLPSSDTIGDSNAIDVDNFQVALCRLTYRPHWQLFPTDIAEQLVKVGKANVASSVLDHSLSSDKSGTSEEELAGGFETKITDTSQRIQDIRRDVKYLDGLRRIEFEAAQNSMGMWSVPEVRQSKKEIVDEVDFQAKASALQKLWRIIRGG